MVDPDRRLAFADFLERLAAHRVSQSEWHEAVVQHYQDQLLESVRSECVRILYHVPDAFRPDSTFQVQLRAWAEALRMSASSAAAS
jgi:hypothetical protein